jgi:putative transcriptional regulator
MISKVPPIGSHLKEARTAAGLTQTQLARISGIPRQKIVRIEGGHTVPSITTTVRLASALKVPLEALVNGRLYPARSLRGIAFELYHLGIRDLVVSDAIVPGSFRRPEQIVVLALKGDRPDPRVVEAIPFVLARRRMNVPITLAFSKLLDPRVVTRLAWLSDIVLTLSKRSDFPLEIISEKQLSGFVRAAEDSSERPARKPTEPDSLGHPVERNREPVWRRWNITYAATLREFLERATTLYELSQDERPPREPDE